VPRVAKPITNARADVPTQNYKPELTAMPDRIARLPVYGGYPIPWFVVAIKGVPDFRLVDPKKFMDALREKRCWTCGGILGRRKAFITGPIAIINRTAAEPPSHYDCAVWAIKNCPFLSDPFAKRNPTDMPETGVMGGCMLKHNPGIIALIVSNTMKVERDYVHGFIITLGPIVTLEWWQKGEKAQPDHVWRALDDGYARLQKACEGRQQDLSDLANAYVKGKDVTSRSLSNG
jgi:hypothetical protein